jgi:hypothetical protein
MIWRVVLSVVAAAALLAGASCTDRPTAVSVDGGEAGALARAREGGVEGGAAAAVDSGVDDLAQPPAVNEELLGRMRHLLEGIAQNNADLAGDIVFPRDGYIASRDTVDPQKAWEKRVSGLFKRSVERTRKRNKGIENAKFTSFELGHAIAQITPKKHDFKKPLWRVKHSKLSFTIDGKVRHLDIAEMTAWRGAWYVTRLR